jgi:hypothetical protein
MTVDDFRGLVSSRELGSPLNAWLHEEKRSKMAAIVFILTPTLKILKQGNQQLAGRKECSNMLKQHFDDPVTQGF